MAELRFYEESEFAGDHSSESLLIRMEEKQRETSGGQRCVERSKSGVLRRIIAIGMERREGMEDFICRGSAV